MRLVLILVMVLLASISLASAMDIAYTIEATVLTPDNQTESAEQNITEQCEDHCAYPISVSVPEGYTIQSYSLSYDSDKYTVIFESTQELTTQKLDDAVVVDVVQEAPQQNNTPPPPQLICNAEECDRGCVKCSDLNCHDPVFVCREDFSIDKITPTSTKVGVSQLNILIKNTGNVDLKEISAEVTGDGIETLESTPIAALAAGDKDYVFVQINASKPGNIDLVIKLYVDNMLNRKSVGSLAVIKPKVDEPKVNDTPEFDPTVLSDQLDQLREKYKTLEKDYNDKKAANYVLDAVTDDIKELHTQILTAQSALYDTDYKKTQTYLALAKDTSITVEQELKDAKPTVVKFSDKLKGNLIYVGSIAAAVVSFITAITLTRQHVVNKEKLANIANRIKSGRTVVEKKKVKKPRKNKESVEKTPAPDSKA